MVNIAEAKPKLLRKQKRLINGLAAIVLVFSLLIYTAPPVHAAPTIEWTAHPAAEANLWQSVTWSPELDLFVAVGGQNNSNLVMTSPDGITWTARTAAVDEGIEWASVTWSPELGRFMAVGTPCFIDVIPCMMSSPDGITWTGHMAEASTWQSIAWSPELNLFVAVGLNNSNQIGTSSNGSTWAIHQATEPNLWLSVTWSPELNLFVAVSGNGTNRVMTSPNGTTWTARAAVASGWRAVTWSPELDLFVAVASADTNRVMTSPNGINWTARTAAEANQWRAVTWSPELDLFVAVAESGTNRVMTSPDGISWTAQAATEANQWVSVAWSSELGRFVAVADSGTNRVMVGNVLDHDNVSNEVEDAAPNGGDGNNDGKRDRFQSHVTSFVNPVTNKYATLEVDEECQISSVAVTAESFNTAADSGFDYPQGLMNFTADCGTPGFTTTVTQYYYGVSKEGLILRKYNPNTNAYFTVTGATLADVTIGGQSATKVTYSVTDGGELDTDGTANGIIVDPVGLAQQAVGVPNTGLGGARW